MNDSLSSRWSVRLGSMVSRRVFGVGAVLTALAGLDADAKKKKKKKKKKKPSGSNSNTGGYVFERSWDGFGDEASQKFDGPVGVAADADGDVYVADTQNDRILKFSNGGAHKSTWETDTVFEDDSIDTPSMITISGNTVYVTSQFRNNVQIFNRNGDFQGLLSGITPGDPDELDGPQGLDIDPSGRVVIADRDANRIQVLSASGDHVDQWGGLPVSSDPGKFDLPVDVAVDGTGNSFVVDWENTRIQKFKSNREFEREWGGATSTGDTKMNAPDGIAVDAAGNVYVTDPGDRVIKKFTNNGGFIERIGSTEASGGGLGFGLHGIAVDADGNVFAVNGDAVVKFRPASSANRLAVESRAKSGRGHGQRGRERSHGRTGRGR
jgi:DNA-binding beta-propeller fold protein YncE